MSAPHANILILRRRNIFERKTMRIVRGESSTSDEHGPTIPGSSAVQTAKVLDENDVIEFARLRECARRNNLEIRPFGAQCLSSSELLLLRWLAEAQRQQGLRTCRLDDPEIKTALGHCAGILKRLGLFLPSQTLRIGSDLDGHGPVTTGILYRYPGHKNRYNAGFLAEAPR